MDFVMVEDVPVAQALVPYSPPPTEVPPPQVSPLLARIQKIKAPPIDNRPVNRRFGNRKSLGLLGHIEYNGVLWTNCTVLDMSAGGAQIEVRPDPRRGPSHDFLPEVFHLIIENLLERSVARCQVRWHSGNRYGVLFLGPIDATIKRLPRRSAARSASDEKKLKPGSR